LGDKLLSPNGITTLLFDLDGTLRYNRPSYFQSFFDFATRSGASDSPENRLRATRWLHYYWAQSEELLEDREKLDPQEDAFWINHARRGLIAFGCSSEEAKAWAPEVFNQFSDNYQPEDWIPQEVIDTLTDLKEGGFSLGVLSNRTHPYKEYMQAWGLDSFFDLAMAAGEVNAYKPDPEIFHHALKAMGKRADESLYVGDNYYADVIGAQRAGLPAILLDPEGVFPDSDCTVIKNINELIEYLDK
jgi:HAD superfamily hydrolase (TIGR01549 family)